MRTVIAWIIFVIVIIIGVWYFLTMKPMPQVPEPQPEVIPAEEEAPQDEVVGIWRSTQDAQFTREFRANGTVIDTYGTDVSATAEGQWDFVTSSELQNSGLPVVNDMILRVQFPEETLYFTVNAETDADTLSLTYLGGNGILMFERI